MTFKEWLKKQHFLADDYEYIAECIEGDEDFPNLPQKSPNRRYLRIEAKYCGYSQLLAFDDLWNEYEADCLPKRSTEWRDRAKEYRRAERQEIVNHLTRFVEEYRTGVCDSLCDKFLDELERLGME